MYCNPLSVLLILRRGLYTAVLAEVALLEAEFAAGHTTEAGSK